MVIRLFLFQETSKSSSSKKNKNKKPQILLLRGGNGESRRPVLPMHGGSAETGDDDAGSEDIHSHGHKLYEGVFHKRVQISQKTNFYHKQAPSVVGSD